MFYNVICLVAPISMPSKSCSEVVYGPEVESALLTAKMATGLSQLCRAGLSAGLTLLLPTGSLKPNKYCYVKKPKAQWCRSKLIAGGLFSCMHSYKKL